MSPGDGWQRSPGAAPWTMLVSDRRRLCAAARRPLAEGADLLLAQARAAADAGVGLFQIREPDLDAATLLGLVERVVAASATRMTVLVNDRADIAAAAGAGVHLRGRSAPAARLRPWLPPATPISRSVHEVGELAELGPVDVVVAGTVFATASKAGASSHLGVDGLSRIVAASPVPVLAIGGMSAATWLEVRATGAAGLAAIGAFLPQGDESVGDAVRRAMGAIAGPV